MKAARLTFASVGALAILLAAAHALEPSRALQAVIEGAKKEGKLEIVAPGSVVGNSQQVQEMGKAMNAAFGTNIAVSYVPGPPSVPQMLDNIETSQKAGLPSPTSVFIAPTELAGLAQRHNAVEKVDWAALLPGRITAKIIEADGTAIRVLPPCRAASSTTRSSRHEAQAAHRSAGAGMEGQDRLDALCGLVRHASARPTCWGEEKALDFARKMAKQVAGLIALPRYRAHRLGRVPRLRHGLLGPHLGRSYKRNGAPIELRGARRCGRTALLLLERAQERAASQRRQALHRLHGDARGPEAPVEGPGRRPRRSSPIRAWRKVVADYEKQGLKFQTIDIAWFDKHPEVAKARSRDAEILATGG